MLFPKLTFNKSSYENLIYKIFRFKNENKDLTIDYYVNNEPDFVINEASAISKTVSLKDHPATIIKNELNDFYSVSCSFDIVKRNTEFIINLKNDQLALPHNKLKITITDNEITKLEYITVSVVTKLITDKNIINTLVRIENPNTILLNYAEFGYNSTSIDVTIETISIDDTSADGIFKPIISMINTKDYLLFYQDVKNHFNRYYYKAIGYNKDYITELSSTNIIDLAEPCENIKTTIEVSDNYLLGEEATWSKLEVEYNPLSEIKVYKNKNEMASNIIPIFYEHEINIDDRLLASDGLRTIKLPNIWNVNKKYIMLRDRKAYRFKNISLENPDIESCYSEVVFLYDKLEILIDKMIILKKNVTGLPDNVARLPITLNDINAKIIKTYIRQGGIYYKDYIINEYETNNTDTSIHDVSLVTLDSRFPLLTIKDSCVYSNIYNYTVYLYDETGNMSEPISIIM